MKVLNKDKIVRTKQVEHTNNEQQMLESVQHPFIINLWGTFQDPANLYMVMDFVPGGELFTLLRRSNVSGLGMYVFGFRGGSFFEGRDSRNRWQNSMRRR